MLYNNATGGNTYFGLGDSDLNDDWGATYSSKTITYSGNWQGRGWWIGTGDYSNYSKLVIEFGAATEIEGNVIINYNTDNQYTDQYFAAGVSSVEVTLDATYKSSVKDIIIKNRTTTGSLTLSSAYLVSNSGSAVPEFRKATTGKIAANKAYLKIPAGSSSKLNIVFAEDENKQGEEQQGETNSIRNIANTNVNSNVVYNMNGQRVGSDYKGLVIVNGKKIIKK